MIVRRLMRIIDRSPSHKSSTRLKVAGWWHKGRRRCLFRVQNRRESKISASDVAAQCKYHSKKNLSTTSSPLTVCLYQGRPLKTNNTTKIIKSNQSLVLQHVTRSSTGRYSCSALNSEGETVSNDFLLKVKFRPLCATDKMMVVGASKGENIQLTCEIEAYPLPKRFYWKFENSEESVEIEQQKFNNNGTRSVLSFSTATDHVRCSQKESLLSPQIRSFQT